MDAPQAFTDDDLRATFGLDATAAAQHARCGHARCRVNALAEVDDVLDEWLARHPVAMAVPDMPSVGARTVAR